MAKKVRKVRKYGVYANRFWIGNVVRFPGGYGEIKAVYYNLEDFWIYYGIVNEVSGKQELVIDKACSDLQP